MANQWTLQEMSHGQDAGDGGEVCNINTHWLRLMSMLLLRHEPLHQTLEFPQQKKSKTGNPASGGILHHIWRLPTFSGNDVHRRIRPVRTAAT